MRKNKKKIVFEFICLENSLTINIYVLKNENEAHELKYKQSESETTVTVNASKKNTPEYAKCIAKN